MDRALATKELPLLNRKEVYVPDAGRDDSDDFDIEYDALSSIRKRTHMSEQKFKDIYKSTMRYFTKSEQLSFKQYLLKQKEATEFYKECTLYLRREFPEMENPYDYKVMMDRIHSAVFGYDVLQPLIDNEDTSDIKICGFNDIRVRVKGKAYNSNATFFDVDDLIRFIDGLACRNRLDIFRYPAVTFTDSHDPNYILRFTVSSPMVTAVGHPYLHIRKISKTKKTFNDLIEEKMLTPKVRDYLIDRAKSARAIVFAGPPGSGKTTALNAFIEYIPRTRETLVIQENDELFTKQTGFMFKHVSHGFQGEPIYTLEDLGKMALVEGCNEFIIGEVKGAEMRYAITLIRAGGYAALTAHSNGAYETHDKLADLIKYGSSYTFNEARQMLADVDVVYMEDYKIKEILECTGYDTETKTYSFINIYRYEGEQGEENL